MCKSPVSRFDSAHSSRALAHGHSILIYMVCLIPTRYLSVRAGVDQLLGVLRLVYRPVARAVESRGESGKCGTQGSARRVGGDALNTHRAPLNHLRIEMPCSLVMQFDMRKRLAFNALHMSWQESMHIFTKPYAQLRCRRLVACDVVIKSVSMLYLFCGMESSGPAHAHRNMPPSATDYCHTLAMMV